MVPAGPGGVAGAVTRQRAGDVLRPGPVRGQQARGRLRARVARGHRSRGAMTAVSRALAVEPRAGPGRWKAAVREAGTGSRLPRGPGTTRASRARCPQLRDVRP